MIIESKSWPYQLKDSAADSKLKLLKPGETFGVEKPGGEKRLHIGSINNQSNFDSYFFPNRAKVVLFEVSKIDLIQYLLSAEEEYTNPIQNYRLPISSYYPQLLNDIWSIKNPTFTIPFEKNVDTNRYYLSRPKGDPNSQNYQYISKICLPLVTIFNLIRIKHNNGTYNFYLKPVFVNPSAAKPDTFVLPEDDPLQQIFYGAPGTGKSHEIQEKEDGFAKVFRTTFHPDSDYSTFVGCYKPVTEKAKLWAPDNVYHPQTAVLLANPNNIENISYRYEAQAFVKAYIEAWKLYAEQITNISAIASATSTGTAAPSEEPKHKEENVKPELPKNNEDGNLPNEKENGEAEQVNTWNHIPCVLLDIEEINRGNCAQIFGDLFQLLDRNDNGFSEYEIIPDSALTKYLANAFKDLDVHVPNIDPYFKKEYKSHIKDGNTRSEDIQSGDILILPPNLYIWATMNTSDQSLFPMDSAFKRRWDWVYMPIDTAKEEWTIKINDSYKCSWTDFLNAINEKIYEVTQSEDKQLGFYFCKAKDEIVDAETFVGKVLFYLWNDVFKDYGFEDAIFNLDEKDSNGVAKKMTYHGFYKGYKKVNEDNVIKFLKNLLGEKVDENENEEEEDEDGNTKSTPKKDYTKYTIDGGNPVGKNKVAYEIVKAYVKKNPNADANAVLKQFENLVGTVSHTIESESDYTIRTDSDRDNRTKSVDCANGTKVYLSTNGYDGVEKVKPWLDMAETLEISCSTDNSKDN